MKNSIFILGGSHSHVPFIEVAESDGYFTVVFDMNHKCPGADHASEFYPISTFSIEEIRNIARRIDCKFPIKGFFTYSTEIKALENTAVLADEFGTPNFSLQAVITAFDKTRMKSLYNKDFVPTSRWETVHSLKDAEKCFNMLKSPVIIKPAIGGNGSFGVSLIRNIEELKIYFNSRLSILHDQPFIIEKFIQGIEFTVDGICGPGTPVVLTISRKYNLGPEQNFVMAGFATLVANRNPELFENLKNIAIQAVNAHGIKNSFFSVDIIHSDEGFFAVESGVLLDCKIDRLLNYTGFNIYNHIIKVVTGQDVNFDEPDWVQSYSLAFMYSREQGRLKIHHLPSGFENYHVEWERSEDEEVAPPETVAGILGWVMCKDLDPDKAFNKACDFGNSGIFTIVSS